MRGQAALEYLTTYGWAFMVLLVMIGALTYLGVADTSTLIPEQCSISPQFSCDDYFLQAPSGDLEAIVVLKNSMKSTIFLEQGSFTHNELTYSDSNCGVYRDSEGTLYADPWPTLNPGEKIELICGVNNNNIPLIAGEKEKLDFQIAYKTSEDGFLHIAQGTLIATVQ